MARDDGATVTASPAASVGGCASLVTPASAGLPLSLASAPPPQASFPGGTSTEGRASTGGPLPPPPKPPPLPEPPLAPDPPPPVAETPPAPVLPPVLVVPPVRLEPPVPGPPPVPTGAVVDPPQPQVQVAKTVPSRICFEKFLVFIATSLRVDSLRLQGQPIKPGCLPIVPSRRRWFGDS